MGIFTEIKDNIFSFSAEAFLKHKFKRYGRMLDLNINSEEKIINIKTQLKGESETLSIRVKNYEFIEEDGSSFIILGDIFISKEWMNLAAQDFFAGKKFPVPHNFSSIFKMLL